jgi:hypothetical protein
MTIAMAISMIVNAAVLLKMMLMFMDDELVPIAQHHPASPLRLSVFI